MEIGETLNVTSGQQWRKWLADHHRQRKEIWLVFYKKASGKRSISYDDAVEEAICYGWIDSQQKPIDKEKFARRFSPRRNGSNWSQYNKARALKMLREGRMVEAGIALLPDELLRMGDEAG